MLARSAAKLCAMSRRERSQMAHMECNEMCVGWWNEREPEVLGARSGPLTSVTLNSHEAET